MDVLPRAEGLPRVLTVPGRRSPSASASAPRSLGSRTSVRKGCLQENGWGRKRDGWARISLCYSAPGHPFNSQTHHLLLPVTVERRGGKEGDERKGEDREQRERESREATFSERLLCSRSTAGIASCEACTSTLHRWGNRGPESGRPMSHG